jgi:hypothetical protein
MSRKFNEHPIYAWRFTGREDFLFNSAFDVESLMVCAAALLASAMGGGVKVHTDCKGIVDRSDKFKKLDNFSRQGQASQFRYIKLAREDESMDLVWVPSHPERREPDSDSWKVEDWGIWFADRVAGGEPQHSFPGEFKISERSMEDAAVGHDMENNWFYWKQDGLVLLNSMTKVLREERAGVYLSKRDEYRMQRGEDPIWQDLTTGYAAKAWRSLGKGIGSRARSTRLMYNKIWDGRNEGKGTGTGEPLRCPLCNLEVDGMDHWVGGCSNAKIVAARAKAVKEVKWTISKARMRDGEWTPSLAYRELLSYVSNKLLGRQDAGRLWSALWSEAELQEMEIYMDRIQEGETDRVQSFFQFIGKATVEGVSDIWETRKTTLKEIKKTGQEVEEEDEEEDGAPLPDPFAEEREGMEAWLREEVEEETGCAPDRPIGRRVNRRRMNAPRRKVTTDRKVTKTFRKKKLTNKEVVVVSHNNKRNKLRATKISKDVSREKGQRDIRSYFQRGVGGFDYG